MLGACLASVNVSSESQDLHSSTSTMSPAGVVSETSISNQVPTRCFGPPGNSWSLSTQNVTTYLQAPRQTPESQTAASDMLPQQLPGLEAAYTLSAPQSSFWTSQSTESLWYCQILTASSSDEPSSRSWPSQNKPPSLFPIFSVQKGSPEHV